MKQALTRLAIVALALGLVLGTGCSGDDGGGGTRPTTTLDIQSGIWTGTVTVLSSEACAALSALDESLTQRLFGPNGLDLCNTTQLEISNQVPVQGCDITVNGNQATMDCDGVFDVTELLGASCQIGFDGGGNASVTEVGDKFTIAVNGDLSFQGPCLGLDGLVCENTSFLVVGQLSDVPCPGAGEYTPLPLRSILNRVFHGAP